MLNNKCYFITGEHLIYILSYLNSKLFTKIVLPQANVTGGKGEGFLNNISLIPPSNESENELDRLYDMRNDDPKKADIAIDEFFCNIYNLSDKERQYILE